ncbi:MAG: succinate dehydrogenase, cytochrome b556 subunit [Roseovarius sp.]|nr:succinate dehydrogenase, cytochrome b556 subunit [Roseovarius sp.]
MSAPSASAGWLAAGAAGPEAFAAAQAVLLSPLGLVVLFLLTLALCYHLCNGIRHLIWDSVRAFELRAIYLGGWTVVVASLVLTLALWAWGLA